MIIGITGKKGSGKDTIADILSKEFGFHKLSLADPIKQALNIVFGWNQRDWEPERKELVDERWGISPRQAAQHLGTEWGQFGLIDSFPKFSEVTGRSLWVRSCLDKVKRFSSVSIADVRFLHEAVAIREEGGLIIRVYRHNDHTDTHPSETEMELIYPDYQIMNDSGMDNLVKSVKEIMTVIRRNNAFRED